MKRVLVAVLILFAVLVATAIGFWVWISRTVNAPHSHGRAADYIKIEKGSTPRQILSQLEAAGIISSSTAALLHLRAFGDSSNIQAGEYQFPSPVTTVRVLKILEKGEDRTIKITIPEGFTRFDIAKRIVERFPQSSGMDAKAIVALMDDVTLIRDLSPQAKNLEGYMYPSTYSFPRDAKPAEVIKGLVDQFRKFWKPEWTDKARSIGRTPHEIVTIASLIETETAVPAERPIVAGVINNRLSRNIPLGIDQTNVYIAKMMDRWDGTIHKSDLEVDSPYNTRIKTGLPPGPISSVTESSLSAALNPTPSDYIFYVKNVDVNDGSHWFYASAAEFERGKQKYQQWLERERVEKRAAESAQTPQ